MDEKINEVGENPVKAEEAGGFFQKWFDLYFNPQKSFQSIDSKPDWVLPVVIMAVVTAIIMVALAPIMHQFQVERLMDIRNLSREQAEDLLQKGRQFQKFLVPISAFIGIFVVEIVAALFFYLVGTVFMAGDVPYKKVLSIWAYTSLAVGIIGMIIRTPLMFIKKTMLVQTSLAAFLSADSRGSLLYRVFSKIDVFMIWQLILVTLGFVAIYKFSTKKSATVVFGLYVLWIVVSVLFGSIFKMSGLGG